MEERLGQLETRWVAGWDKGHVGIVQQGGYKVGRVGRMVWRGETMWGGGKDVKKGGRCREGGKLCGGGEGKGKRGRCIKAGKV